MLSFMILSVKDFKGKLKEKQLQMRQGKGKGKKPKSESADVSSFTLSGKGTSTLYVTFFLKLPFPVSFLDFCARRPILKWWYILSVAGLTWILGGFHLVLFDDCVDYGLYKLLYERIKWQQRG